MDWQPIETAPQGEPVIVACPPGSEDKQWIVGEAYFYLDENWPGAGGWWWANEGPGDYCEERIINHHSAPTHWMPLPAPPTPASPEKKE